MSELTVQRRFRFRRARHGRKVMKQNAPEEAAAIPPGRIPRISRLMALAIRFDGLITSGELADQAEIARLGHVSRARVTQIMNLLYLAPDIQEAILFLPKTHSGRDPIREIMVRPVAAVPDWRKQRVMWRQLVRAQSVGR